MYDGEDALWYDNTKLLRQNVDGDWESVFSEARSILKLLSKQNVNTMLSLSILIEKLIQKNK